MTPPLLQALRLTKSFPGVRALKGVSLTLHPGEVLSVIGENGAGKSTLMKILAGVQTPDSGEIRLDGQPIELRSVHDAQKYGIALIHQELNLADNLEVAANIFLGREHLRWGLIDTQRLYREAETFLTAVGLEVHPATRVSELSLGQQQLVEIAKALSVQARVLIMDEPTSSLSSSEAATLFRVIRDLRSRGVSLVYISHRLGEVKELSDRVTVLRDGENAGDLERAEIHHAAMVRLMVGRDLSQFYAHEPHPPGAPVLQVRDLRTPANPRHPVSFEVRAGEIVGMAGLIGAGRTEVLEALFGVTPAVSGSIRLGGTDVRPESPEDAIAAGMALVPEDRKHQGVILEMAVRTNLSLASLRQDQQHGFLNRTREASLSEEMIRSLRIKTPSENQPVQFLSGGNQQKVVLGKWLALRPKVLLLDEPTRGIDVGAKHEIYRLMEELSRAGVAILFVSSELEEILGLSDRVLVLHEGRLTGELARADLSEEAVLHLATDTLPPDPVPASPAP
ncbi:MAG: sugar ABC transporter ATP-binding protein [Verrucomicrobia bacterium]|nr:sugar ABC transporter ATP-binding protein [Verrucomicrobiota bacterium]